MTEPMPELDLSTATIDDATEEEAPTRTRKPRSDKGKPRGPRSTGGTSGRRSKSAIVNQITDDLLVPYAGLAASLALVAPTVSGVLLARGEKTVGAVVNIASKNPRMLAALQKASQVGPAVEIAETLLMVGIAGAMDFGRMPPEHPLGMALGVSAVYAETHDMSQMPQAAPSGMPFMPFPAPAPQNNGADPFVNATPNVADPIFGEPTQQWGMPG